MAQSRLSVIRCRARIAGERRIIVEYLPLGSSSCGTPIPLYAYHCTDCRHEFETLSRFDETPDCPSCGGAHIERQLSMIAKPAAGGETGEGACAAMSGGAPCPSCPALAGGM